jgi:acetyltransferase-like isoleucine patch superfamily enzyme
MGRADSTRPSLYRYLATSDRVVPRLVRQVRRALREFHIPAPRLVVWPAVGIFLGLRRVWYFVVRVFICEPFFKAHCASYGRNLKTGEYLHWIQGKGRIVVGDDVWLDGKSSFTFAHRYADRPELIVGDHAGIGHGCSFVVGKRITIGRHTMIARGTSVFDSSGHAADPVARRAGQPPSPEEVREVVIGNDVWIGHNCIISPGGRIGDGSIVSAGSVVHSHVPPRAVVAGNPARVMFRLKPPPDQGG